MWRSWWSVRNRVVERKIKTTLGETRWCCWCWWRRRRWWWWWWLDSFVKFWCCLWECENEIMVYEYENDAYTRAWMHACMYVCMYSHVYHSAIVSGCELIYIHACIRVMHIHAYIHSLPTAQMVSELNPRTRIHTYAHKYIHQYIHTHIHTYTHTHMYLTSTAAHHHFCYLPYIHTYIHTYAHTQIHNVHDFPATQMVLGFVLSTQTHNHTHTHIFTRIQVPCSTIGVRLWTKHTHTHSHSHTHRFPTAQMVSDSELNTHTHILFT